MLPEIPGRLLDVSPLLGWCSCCQIRPHRDLPNLSAASVLPVAKKDGVLPSFLAAHKRIPAVGTRDIGKAIARALLDGPRGVRVIELAGPADVSPEDVAVTLSRLLGKKINVAEAPLEAVVPTFTSFGISANIAGLFREMYQGMAEGRIAPEPGAEVLRGTIPLEDTLRDLLG